MPKRTACVRRRGPRGGGNPSSEDVSDGEAEPWKDEEDGREDDDAIEGEGEAADGSASKLGSSSGKIY